MSMTEAFAFFDADSSGHITRKEFASGFRKMRIDDAELQNRVWAILDENSSDQITKDEFQSVFKNWLS